MYKRIYDCGHSWLQVSKKEMARIGFLGKTTGFSFEDDDFVYLEEDCDLTTFIKMKEKIGEVVEWEDDTTLEDSGTARFYDVANVRPVSVDAENSDCDFRG